MASSAIGQWHIRLQSHLIDPAVTIDELPSLIATATPSHADSNDVGVVFALFKNLVHNHSMPYRFVSKDELFNNKIKLFKHEDEIVNLISYLSFVAISVRQERWRIARCFDLPQGLPKVMEEKVRRSVALMAVRESPEQVTPLLSQFGLKSPRDRCRLFLEALLYDRNTMSARASYMLDAEMDDDQLSFCRWLEKACSSDINHATLLQVAEEASQRYLPQQSSDIVDALKKGLGMSLYEYRQLVHWFVTALARISLSQHKDTLLEGFQSYHLFPLLLAVPSQQAKEQLFAAAKKVLACHQGTSILQMMLSKAGIKAVTAHTRPLLALLCLAFWSVNGLSEGKALALAAKMPQRPLKKGSKQPHYFRMLMRFSREPLTFAESLATRIIDIWDRKGSDKLNELTSLYLTSLTGQLSTILNRPDGDSAFCYSTIMRLLPGIDVNDEFIRGFSQTFLAYKNPDLIPAYIADLTQLPETYKQQVFPLLARYIVAVSQGVFPQLRYAIDGSRHLAALHKVDPQLIDKWKGERRLSPAQLGRPDLANSIVIEETDDPLKLLDAGNLPPGGNCQRIPGECGKNKAALGDVLHGQMKLITISHADSITATAFIILLLDEREERAVLFLDELYPARIDDDDRQLLTLYARHRAASLHLAAMTLHQGKGPPRATTLKSLAGPAPYIDCDALKRQCPNGVYELDRVQDL